MLNNPITIALILGLMSIYFAKLFIIRKYNNLNIDQYNHNAFINSLSTNFKIKTSALREINTYPFLIHMLMNKIKNKFISKYFSFFFEVIFMILMACYMYQTGVDAQLILSALIILSISTTSFSQVRFFSARVFGLFFFNVILLTTSTDFPIEIKILIEVICLIPIILASKFAHQVYVFAVLPAAIMYSQMDILYSYPLALALTYLITKGFIVEILRAHILHCYWSFYNHMDYYVFGHYFREFEDEKVERNEFSLERSARNLFSVVKNPVVLLIPVLFIYNSDLKLDFNVILITIVVGIFLLLGLYSRLNRSIGEAGRYFDYILLPLTLALYSAGILASNLFYIFLLVIFILSSIWIFFQIRKENRTLTSGGRVFDSEQVAELGTFLRQLPKSKIVSLPISISNYIANISEHKTFYPYSYFAQYFLKRRGVLPFFKFDDKNLLSKKYIDYLVVDIKQIPVNYLAQIINRYKYTLIYENASYQVYQKVK